MSAKQKEAVVALFVLWIVLLLQGLYPLLTRH